MATGSERLKRAAVIKTRESFSPVQSTPMSPTPPAPPTGDRPTVFISYSHADEPGKARVAKPLEVLVPEGVLEVWHDRHIAGGGDWLAEIQAAMGRASVAVLLI